MLCFYFHVVISFRVVLVDNDAMSADFLEFLKISFGFLSFLKFSSDFLRFLGISYNFSGFLGYLWIS